MQLTGTLVTYGETAPRTMLGRPVVCLPGSLHLQPGTPVRLDHRPGTVGTVTGVDTDGARVRVILDVDDDQVPDLVTGLSPGLDVRVGYLDAAGDTYLIEFAVVDEVSLTVDREPAFPSSRLDDEGGQ